MARAAKKETSLTTEEKLAKALVPEEEQPYPVPENWCWVRLNELCAIPITDGTHKTPSYCKKEDGIPFISAKDITKEKICWDNIKYITPKLHKELYARLAPKVDDVLLAKNGTTGVAAIVDIEKVFDIYVTLAVLRPNKRIIIPRYLLNVLNSLVCKNQFDEHLTGIGVPNLHLRDIKSTAIPLPPLSEQQRIVTLIESLFADLDAAKEKLQAVLDGFAERRASLLHQAFTGELTREWREEHGVKLDSWKYLTVKEICTEVKVGIVIKPSQYYTDAVNGTAAFRSANVREFHIDDFDWVYIDETGMKSNQRSIVHTGDVLVVRSGNPGTACVVEEKFDGYNAIDVLIAVPNKEIVTSNYLCAFTNSPMGRTLVTENKRGIALAHFNVSGYSKLELPVPSLEEQKEISDILFQLLAKESQSKAAVESVLSEIDTLKKTILATAFRGGFETNDSSDESAEELLRRVL